MHDKDHAENLVDLADEGFSFGVLWSILRPSRVMYFYYLRLQVQLRQQQQKKNIQKISHPAKAQGINMEHNFYFLPLNYFYVSLHLSTT